MRWLYRMIFLEKWKGWLFGEAKQPLSSRKEAKEILYKIELDSLVWFLQGQLQERVYYSVNERGHAIIGTVSETIADMTLHPKGTKKNLVFIMVHLEEGYEMHKAWFQLAFLGFKVKFRRPILTLHSSWAVPRGQ